MRSAVVFLGLTASLLGPAAARAGSETTPRLAVDGQPPAAAVTGSCGSLDAKKTRVTFDQSVLDWARAFLATQSALGANDKLQATTSLNVFKGSTNAIGGLAADPVVSACLARTPDGAAHRTALLAAVADLDRTTDSTRTNVLLIGTPAGIFLDPHAIGKRFGDAVVTMKTSAFAIVADLKAEALSDAAPASAAAPAAAAPQNHPSRPAPALAATVRDPAELIARIERNQCDGLTAATAPWLARGNARAFEAEGLAYARTCDREGIESLEIAAYRRAIAAGLHDPYVSAIVALTATPPQTAKGRALLMQALAQGSFFAPHTLAVVDAGNFGASKNEAAARMYAKRGAARGDSLCLVFLADEDIRGAGVARDLSAGIALLEKAEALHDAAAADYLGSEYYSGTGVPQDRERAGALYKESAEGHDPNGEGNYAFVLANGSGGFPTDLPLAYEYDRRAAEAGVPEAMGNLGYDYLHGEGVTRDYGLAMSWSKKAAASHIGEAENNIGVMYKDGDGVTPDPARAEHWFELALRDGSIYARNNLASLSGSNGSSQAYRNPYDPANPANGMTAAQREEREREQRQFQQQNQQQPQSEPMPQQEQAPAYNPPPYEPPAYEPPPYQEPQHY